MFRQLEGFFSLVRLVLTMFNYQESTQAQQKLSSAESRGGKEKQKKKFLLTVRKQHKRPENLQFLSLLDLLKHQTPEKCEAN